MFSLQDSYQIDDVVFCVVFCFWIISRVSNFVERIASKWRTANLTKKTGDNEGQYLGCYKDLSSNRDLSAYNTNLVDNSPQNCIYTCLKGGYQYAGLQFSKECWCGDSFGSHGKVDEKACDSKCPGSSNVTSCGGYLSQNIYTTGVGYKRYHYANLVNPENTDANSWVRIAFILTFNGRALRQVKRLFKAIYHVNHYYYIHVDERQDYLHRELKFLTKRYHNVRFTPWRLAPIWGGASLLKMLLRCMQDLTDMKDWSWDFFVNLSESDFPVKSIEELTAFLTKQKDRNFVKSFGKKTFDFIRKQGLDRTFHECDNHMWRLGSRDLPTGIRIDGGSDWVALNRKFCDYLLSDQNPLITGLKILHTYTILSAESFFHTLLQNSEFCDTVVDNNLHFTNWRRKQGCKCQYKKIVDWCGCSPNDLKTEDLGKIVATQQKAVFFARKFEAIVNNDIINQVDEIIHGDKQDGAQATIHSFWQSEWHHLDKQRSEDDIRLSYYTAFKDLGVDSFREGDKNCDFVALRTLEATLYSKMDSIQAILVQYEARSSITNKVYKLETWLEEKAYYRVEKVEGPAGRLLELMVGTDYDPKEEIFRNFASVIGPYSEVALSHSWGPGKKFTAAIIWIDPTNRLIAAFEIAISKESQFTALFKPDFNLPLLPGVWTVRLLYKWQTIAETRFLVLPMSTIKGRPIQQHEALLVNAGQPSSFLYTGRNFSLIAEQLQLDGDPTAIQRVAKMINLTGVSLRQHMKRLAGAFWTAKTTCSDGVQRSPCSKIESCQRSQWSSLFADPKSELGAIQPWNGRIR